MYFAFFSENCIDRHSKMGVVVQLTFSLAVVFANVRESRTHDVTYSNMMSAVQNFGGLDELSLTLRRDTIKEKALLGKTFLEFWQGTVYGRMDKQLLESESAPGKISKICEQSLNMTVQALFKMEPWAIRSKNVHFAN